MTRKAQDLGMTQTVFANASGLPDAAQVTTARDLALLGRALVADFPDRYGLFSKTYVVFGDGSQPPLTGWRSAYPGPEGTKTGLTRGPTSAARRVGKARVRQCTSRGSL